MKTQKYLIVILALLFSELKSQTVTDFDGNVYQTVEIGTQTWMKENLKSLHYHDGTEIPGVVAYSNSDSLGNIYGLLYDWNAAMRNSNLQGTQGVCPNGWHLPAYSEWNTLANFLGTASVAGGKMKEEGTNHWMQPNTGATNSSGFSALGSGEFDAYSNPNSFQLFNQYEVYWTSTNTNSSKAREVYLSYDNAALSVYDWFKVMKYSIRCVKDFQTDINQIKNINSIQIYPNPAQNSVNISINNQAISEIEVKIFSSQGEFIEKRLINNSGYLELSNYPSGFYYFNFELNTKKYFYKIIKL